MRMRNRISDKGIISARSNTDAITPLKQKKLLPSYTAKNLWTKSITPYDFTSPSQSRTKVFP